MQARQVGGKRRPWHVTKPCDDCPFRRTGGIRLRAERILELARDVTGNPGAQFWCHKTTGKMARVRRDLRNQQCAGALIFCERQGKSTQLMRIAERLGGYDAAALCASPDAADIFDTLAEWLATAI